MGLGRENQLCLSIMFPRPLKHHENKCPFLNGSRDFGIRILGSSLGLGTFLAFFCHFGYFLAFFDEFWPFFNYFLISRLRNNLQGLFLYLWLPCHPRSARRTFLTFFCHFGYFLAFFNKIWPLFNSFFHF